MVSLEDSTRTTILLPEKLSQTTPRDMLRMTNQRSTSTEISKESRSIAAP